MPEFKKRETAYKLRIGDLLRGNQIFDSGPEGQKKLIHIELGNKKLVRVNLLANVIEKYESEGERRFASLTVDDGSGQIRIRVFGEDISKFNEFNQGDTIMIIGLLRYFNNEIYILPEILKKQDPRYLLVRKLEIEKQYSSQPINKEVVKAFRDQILDMIRFSETNEGIDTEELVMNVKARPDLITQEIKKLLEEGIIYEPKPGRLRYLG